MSINNCESHHVVNKYFIFIMNNQMNCVYIGDLPLDTTEVFIEETLLGDYEGISKIKLFRKTNETYCFVSFFSEEMAKKVIMEMNYTKIYGKPIRILPTDNETMEIIRSKLGNIIIWGFDEDIEPSQLHEAFSTYGEVISCKIPMSVKNGKWVSDGYGYVQFCELQNALKCIKELKCASINDKPIFLCESINQSRGFKAFLRTKK